MKKSISEPGLNETLSNLILYKTNAFWICIKPAGMPVQADKTGDKSLLDLMEIYGHRTFFPVHRLDRPVSGLVILARTKSAAASLSKAFQDQEIEKIYLAVTSEKPDPPEGKLEHHIRSMEQQNKAILTDGTHPSDRLAVLHYKCLASSDRYHLLEIKTEGGRFHQIRAQLATIGCPIKGDVKYGARRGNKDRSIHLHAWKLAFRHPVSGEMLEFTAPLPANDPVWDAFGAHLGLETSGV